MHSSIVAAWANSMATQGTLFLFIKAEMMLKSNSLSDKTDEACARVDEVFRVDIHQLACMYFATKA